MTLIRFYASVLAYSHLMKHGLCVILALAVPLATAYSATIEEVSTKTGAKENKAPAWIKHGAYVYRICTPDDAD